MAINTLFNTLGRHFITCYQLGEGKGKRVEQRVPKKIIKRARVGGLSLVSVSSFRFYIGLLLGPYEEIRGTKKNLKNEGGFSAIR